MFLSKKRNEAKNLQRLFLIVVGFVLMPLIAAETVDAGLNKVPLLHLKYDPTIIPESDKHSVAMQMRMIEVVFYINIAKELMKAKNWENASLYLNRAEQLCNRSGGSKKHMASIKQLVKQVKSAEKAEFLAIDSEDRNRAQQNAIDAAYSMKTYYENVFEERIQRVLLLLRRELFELALEKARLLVQDFPNKEIANIIYLDVLEKTHNHRDLTIEEKRVEMVQEVNEQMHNSLIPYFFNKVIRYPDDWFERVKNRKSVILEGEQSAWMDKIKNALAERVSVDFTSTEVSEVIDDITTKTAVNLLVDSAVRANNASLINISVRDMRLDHILDWICLQSDLHWKITEGAVVISESPYNAPISNVYDVSRLAFKPQDFQGIQMNLSNVGEGSSASDLFGDEEDSESGISTEDIIDLIKETVDPDVWDNGAVCEIFMDEYLIVKAPPKVQKKVATLLKSMLSVEDIMVSVSTDWVSINDSFIEEIGIDWSNEGHALRNQSHYGAYYPEDSSMTANGIIDSVLPSPIMNLTTESINPGLNLQWSSLGSVEIAAVFKALEKRTRARRVTGCSLSVLNGAKGNVYVGKSYAYIADYEVVTGEVSNLNPQIEVVSDGVALTVRPIVSADKKFVTLDIQPSFTETTFDTVEIQGLVNIVSDTVLLITLFSYPIQLPNYSMKSASTRGDVPDGGSLLVGGFGKSINQKSRVSVPVLGNIPFIGRLFGRRGLYSQNEKIYLIVKVKIIINSEEETML